MCIKHPDALMCVQRNPQITVPSSKPSCLPRPLLLQFNVTNTIAEQRLVDVSMKVENSEPELYDEILSIKCDKLGSLASGNSESSSLVRTNPNPIPSHPQRQL